MRPRTQQRVGIAIVITMLVLAVGTVAWPAVSALFSALAG